jgi:hypothetical protein
VTDNGSVNLVIFWSSLTDQVSENRFHAQHLLPRAVDKLTDDHVATIYEAYQVDIYLSLEVFRRDFVNPVLYPSIATILIKLRVLLTMPVASAIAEMSFSVLRRKNRS